MEEAALWLLKTTGSREDIRVSVCSDRLLSAFRPLIISAYSSIQVNSVAALVDLSTEKVNRVKIVQSGILPNLVFVLETGSPDVQELADRALIQLGPRWWQQARDRPTRRPPLAGRHAPLDKQESLSPLGLGTIPPEPLAAQLHWTNQHWLGSYLPGPAQIEPLGGDITSHSVQPGLLPWWTHCTVRLRGGALPSRLAWPGRVEIRVGLVRLFEHTACTESRWCAVQAASCGVRGTPDS